MGRYLNREPHEPQLEDGETYDAAISKVEDEDGVETQWGEKDRYVITFDVRDGTRLVELRARYNKSMWPKSNYFKLLTTLDPDNFDGIGYDADDLVDKPCRVLIEHTKDDIGGVWDNIANVLKPKKQSTFPKDEAVV